MKGILLSIYLISLGLFTFGQGTEYQTKLNIPYYSASINKSDKYIKERCVLDVYYLKNIKGFSIKV